MKYICVVALLVTGMFAQNKAAEDWFYPVGTTTADCATSLAPATLLYGECHLADGLYLTTDGGMTWTKFKGTDGINGTNGTSITGATVNSAGDLIITYSDGSTTDAGHVVGSPGQQGMQGIQGVPGIVPIGQPFTVSLNCKGQAGHSVPSGFQVTCTETIVSIP